MGGGEESRNVAPYCNERAEEGVQGAAEAAERLAGGILSSKNKARVNNSLQVRSVSCGEFVAADGELRTANCGYVLTFAPEGIPARSGHAAILSFSLFHNQQVPVFLQCCHQSQQPPRYLIPLIIGGRCALNFKHLLINREKSYC